MLKIKDLPPIETNPDNSQPNMTPSQRRRAVKLIKMMCSYYDDGYCLYLDSGKEITCPQSISCSVNCKFFRQVLLEDTEGLSLKAEIFRDDTTKHCFVCSKAFQSKSNNAKYCNDCAKIIQRKQKAKYARKRRSRVEK